MSAIELLSLAKDPIMKELAHAVEPLRHKNSEGKYDKRRDELLARACEALAALIRL